MAKEVKHTTVARSKRLAQGNALREQIPFDALGRWSPAADRPDPLELLQAQDQGRLESLLPIKYGRMLDSPFTFFRGSAVVMASDLASHPDTGIEAVLCGDAHLSNFGIFASPERRTVFDLNDFDEAFPGPWEWDLKRLAASAVIAGRDNGFDEDWCRQLAYDVADSYITALDEFSQMHTVDQWYYHISTDAVLEVFEDSSKKGLQHAVKMVDKAKDRTREQTLDKLTELVDGQRRIISDPPLLVPLRELDLAAIVGDADASKFSVERVEAQWLNYQRSLPDDRRYLLERFEITSMALRVGGIGSVGTRCFIALLKGGADDDHLILQLKEAGPSVIEPYVKHTVPYDSPAQRVVIGQRIMQATSDIFLGWSQSRFSDHYFYWRQLKDMKGSANIAKLNKKGLQTYVTVCGVCLARAHARTGDEIKIYGYTGKEEAFGQAIADFAVAYADQAEKDYGKLVKAVKSGRIVAETGI
jgi:uncharacterized protein (DUF2252 family)